MRSSFPAACIAIGLLLALLPIGALAANVELVLAPGQSGTLVIPVHNPSSLPATVVLSGYYAGPAPFHSEYEFLTASDTRCAMPQMANHRSQIAVGPLAAGETLECRWQVARSATSRNDIAFGICTDVDWPAPCPQFAHVGWAPDMSLATRQVGIAREGDTEIVVRVSARNRSEVPTAPRRIQTECMDFANHAPFELRNDFEGACPTAPLENGCINFTGTNDERREFFVGAMAPGGETSCLLKLRLRSPLTREVSLALAFEDFRTPLAGGGIGYDSNPANDATRIGAAIGGGIGPVPLPTGGPAAWLLGIVLAVAASWRLRRRLAN
ncbi:MAG: hypothetical protein J0L88_08550 [Xanthomonadales bacterium]|nr:hypothetical protein [Xanthomonadales bacterium]